MFVGVLEFFNDITFYCLLEGFNRLFLIKNLHAHFGCDLLDKLAERTLLHKQIGRSLQLLDGSKGDCAALETVFSLLDTRLQNGVFGVSGGRSV